MGDRLLVGTLHACRAKYHGSIGSGGRQRRQTRAPLLTASSTVLQQLHVPQCRSGLRLDPGAAIQRCIAALSLDVPLLARRASPTLVRASPTPDKRSLLAAVLPCCRSAPPCVLAARLLALCRRRLPACTAARTRGTGKCAPAPVSCRSPLPRPARSLSLALSPSRPTPRPTGSHASFAARRRPASPRLCTRTARPRRRCHGTEQQRLRCSLADCHTHGSSRPSWRCGWVLGGSIGLNETRNVSAVGVLYWPADCWLPGPATLPAQTEELTARTCSRWTHGALWTARTSCVEHATEAACAPSDMTR